MTNIFDVDDGAEHLEPEYFDNLDGATAGLKLEELMTILDCDEQRIQELKDALDHVLKKWLNQKKPTTFKSRDTKTQEAKQELQEQMEMAAKEWFDAVKIPQNFKQKLLTTLRVTQFTKLRKRKQRAYESAKSASTPRSRRKSPGKLFKLKLKDESTRPQRTEGRNTDSDDTDVTSEEEVTSVPMQHPALSVRGLSATPASSTTSTAFYSAREQASDTTPTLVPAFDIVTSPSLLANSQGFSLVLPQPAEEKMMSLVILRGEKYVATLNIYQFTDLNETAKYPDDFIDRADFKRLEQRLAKHYGHVPRREVMHMRNTCGIVEEIQDSITLQSSLFGHFAQGKSAVMLNQKGRDSYSQGENSPRTPQSAHTIPFFQSSPTVSNLSSRALKSKNTRDNRGKGIAIPALEISDDSFSESSDPTTRRRPGPRISTVHSPRKATTPAPPRPRETADADDDSTDSNTPLVQPSCLFPSRAARRKRVIESDSEGSGQDKGSRDDRSSSAPRKRPRTRLKSVLTAINDDVVMLDTRPSDLERDPAASISRGQRPQGLNDGQEGVEEDDDGDEGS